MRTFICSKCVSLHDMKTVEDAICKCGHSFLGTPKISHYINMRTTWSGQTKLEFSQTTMDEDIKSRGGRI